jgi:hypothetical protein
MKRSETELKAKQLSGYLTKEVTLRQNIPTIKTQTFKLTGFFERCWGTEIRDSSNFPLDMEKLSCSLYAILSNESNQITNIDIDVVIDAIDNNKVIDYSFS